MQYDSFYDEDGPGYFDYNPAHAVWYLLVQAGFPESRLNSESFLAAAITIYEEGKVDGVTDDGQEVSVKGGISAKLGSQIGVKEYIIQLLAHMNGVMTWANDGKFHLLLIRDNYSVEDLPIVNENVLLEEPMIDRASWPETYGEISVQYNKRVYPPSGLKYYHEAVEVIRKGRPFLRNYGEIVEVLHAGRPYVRSHQEAVEVLHQNIYAYLDDISILWTVGSTTTTTTNTITTSTTIDLSCWADDSFTGEDGDPPSSFKWSLIDTPDIQDNQVEIFNDGVGYSERITSRGIYGTSFEVDIDFNIQSADANSFNCQLQVVIDDTHRIYISAARLTSLRYFQKGHINGLVWTYNAGPRTNNTGSLRVVRSGNQFTVYRKDGGGDWAILGGGAYTIGNGTEDCTVSVFNGTWDTNPAITCRYDNFVVNEGCPTPPYTTTTTTTTTSTTIIPMDGLELWLDADDDSTITESSNLVSEWRDKSGSSNHAGQSGDPEKYTLVTGSPASRQHLSSANGDHMDLTSEIANVRSLYIVEKHDGSDSDYRFIVGSGATYYDFHGGITSIFYGTWINANIYPNGITRLDGVVIPNPTVTNYSGSWEVLTIETAGNVRLNRLGEDRELANRNWLGDYAEVLIYNRILDSDEKKVVRDYIYDKWGVQAYTTTTTT
jgi:hypothetical protein